MRKTSQGERKKEKRVSVIKVKPWLKRRKNLQFYETLLAELRSEDEYNCNTLRNISADKRRHNYREH